MHSCPRPSRAVGWHLHDAPPSRRVGLRRCTGDPYQCACGAIRAGREEEGAKASLSLAQGDARYEFKGGDDDFQDYYCPTIEWNWGDGTVSEASNDCDPYESGVSEIRRRYTQSHTYKRSGAFRIVFRLKHRDRVLTSQTTLVRLLGGGF